MTDQSTSGPTSAQDGFNIANRKITPDIERTRVWAELWHKIVDRLLSTPFLAFILVMLVVAAGLWFLTNKTEVKDVMDFWKLILPVVTLYVGYAIGQNSKEP